MKFRNLLTLLIAFLFATNTMAAVVQQDVAVTVAKNFMFERLSQKGIVSHLSDITATLVQTVNHENQPVYYVYNINNNGWIIISAEDAYTPVIGYALEGTFPHNKSNQNFSSFMQDYIDQINYARENNLTAQNKTIEEWNIYTGLINNRSFLDGTRDVEPLLEIMWNQDFPYNAYCPEDANGPGGHVYAGCVATAMSMIMYYYRYPEVGTGSKTYYPAGYGAQTANFGETHYNWDAMTNSVTAGMGHTVNAVAELQYHCGVAVNMQYSPTGSGAYSQDVPNAIKSYFGYHTSATFAQKMSYTATVWENMLIDHLNTNKPLYYSGQSTEGGHAFVCDGFQETGTGKLFHFNFGWSGSGNGYYTLNDVGGYSSQQAVVKNFIPNTNNYPYYCDNHVITADLGSFEDMSGPWDQYQSNSGCSWLIAPEDSVESITVNFNKFNLGTGDSVRIFAGMDNSAPVIASFGQSTPLAQVTAETNAMFVEFITDGLEEGDGFRAEYSSTYPVFCTNSITTLSEPTGEFTDGSGNKNYNNNSICKWKINPGPWAQDLTLAFSEFDLEDGKDFLKVYEIPTNVLLANLTGNQVPEPIASSTGQMMIMFSTNGYNNNQGFSASYYISNVSTSEEDIAQNLSIFPNPATTYTDIKFNLQERSNIKVSVHNLLGEEVYSEPSQLQTGYVSKTVQLGGLSKGVYLVKISSDKGSITKKLVVR